MELNSNVKGCVLVVENGTIQIRDEDGLLHFYSNVLNEKVELGQTIEVGDTLGETGEKLSYIVTGIDLANELN